jgi:hypothetical protein
MQGFTHVITLIYPAPIFLSIRCLAGGPYLYVHKCPNIWRLQDLYGKVIRGLSRELLLSSLLPGTARGFEQSKHCALVSGT